MLVLGVKLGDTIVVRTSTPVVEELRITVVGKKGGTGLRLAFEGPRGVFNVIRAEVLERAWKERS